MQRVVATWASGLLYIKMVALHLPRVDNERRWWNVPFLRIIPGALHGDMAMTRAACRMFDDVYMEPLLEVMHSRESVKRCTTQFKDPQQEASPAHSHLNGAIDKHVAARVAAAADVPIEEVSFEDAMGYVEEKSKVSPLAEAINIGTTTLKLRSALAFASEFGDVQTVEALSSVLGWVYPMGGSPQYTDLERRDRMSWVADSPQSKIMRQAYINHQRGKTGKPSVADKTVETCLIGGSRKDDPDSTGRKLGNADVTPVRLLISTQMGCDSRLCPATVAPTTPDPPPDGPYVPQESSRHYVRDSALQAALQELLLKTNVLGPPGERMFFGAMPTEPIGDEDLNDAEGQGDEEVEAASAAPGASATEDEGVADNCYTTMKLQELNPELLNVVERGNAVRDYWLRVATKETDPDTEAPPEKIQVASSTTGKANGQGLLLHHRDWSTDYAVLSRGHIIMGKIGEYVYGNSVKRSEIPAGSTKTMPPSVLLSMLTGYKKASLLPEANDIPIQKIIKGMTREAQLRLLIRVRKADHTRMETEATDRGDTWQLPCTPTVRNSAFQTRDVPKPKLSDFLRCVTSGFRTEHSLAAVADVVGPRQGSAASLSEDLFSEQDTASAIVGGESYSESYVAGQSADPILQPDSS